MMIGYHGHTNITNPEAFGAPASWETAMSYSKFNGINLDIGHFTAANNTSPIPFMQKYHDRITHIHVKDRRMNNGPNVPWGTGDTPIKETLKTIQKEKYRFMAAIEHCVLAREGERERGREGVPERDQSEAPVYAVAPSPPLPLSPLLPSGETRG